MAAGAQHVGASGSVREAFDWKCYLKSYKQSKSKSKLKSDRKFLKIDKQTEEGVRVFFHGQDESP